MAAQSSLSISLAGRVGHLFDPQTILQGFVCHTKGVELTARGDTGFTARVKGKRTHAVTLSVRAGALAVDCSCPAKSYGQSYCKHLWAALLEVDRHGGLDELRTARTQLEMVAAETAPTAEETQGPSPPGPKKPAEPPKASVTTTKAKAEPAKTGRAKKPPHVSAPRRAPG